MGGKICRLRGGAQSSRALSFNSSDAMQAPNNPTAVHLAVPTNMAVNIPPRGRVVLQPGHSQMDWIRLSATRDQLVPDQSGPVTCADLVQHNSVSDCWILLEGVVYDVTPYLSYHPGGVDELMRAAGRDGTALFREQHAYINFASMLESCVVGRFIGNPTELPPTEPREERPERDAHGIRVLPSGPGELRLQTPYQGLSADNVCVDVQERVLRLLITPFDSKIAMEWTDIRPEWTADDWSVSVEGGSLVKLNMGHKTDMTAVLSQELITVQQDPGRFYRECELDRIVALNGSTSLYILCLPTKCKFALPLGSHVDLQIRTEGGEMRMRPYTPVFLDAETYCVHFIIKLYPGGRFTQPFGHLAQGATVYMSDPIGDGVDLYPSLSARLLVLSAGTGITPMIMVMAKHQHVNNARAWVLHLTGQGEGLNDQALERCGLAPNGDYLNMIRRESVQHTTNESIVTELIIEHKDELLAGNAEKSILICGPIGFMDMAMRVIGDTCEQLLPRIHVFDGGL